MILNWNYQRGGGSNQKTFHGRGMNIFLNNTFDLGEKNLNNGRKTSLLVSHKKVQHLSDRICGRA